MIESQDVEKWLHDADQPYSPDDEHVELVVATVNDYVDRLPSVPRISGTDGSTSWAPSAKFGAILLAARLVRRRNSPAGIESFTADGATYITRHDPDIAMMLRVGRQAAPKVG